MSAFSKPSVSIAICDDEPKDLEEMETMTNELLEAEGISCGVSRFGDAGSLLSAAQGGENFDILLLDVIMENLNGIELAAALRKQGNDTAIVFISINREMALLGYEVSAVRYLATAVWRIASFNAAITSSFVIRSSIDIPTILSPQRSMTPAR